MGFFKDFKEDLSQAVTELSDDATKFAAGGDGQALPDDDVMVDTLDEEVQEPVLEEYTEPEEDVTVMLEEAIAQVAEPVSVFEETMEETEIPEDAVSDETAIITPGLKIIGDIESIGSIELLGTVQGNVTCRGKLVVSGTIKGNTSSSDFFANKAKIEGDINCEGTAKVGDGTVIIGNLLATSAVIAGAIKGDIDVHGPVIVDTSAIVMGNIKSKSVQINNGAVIEGYCSQCYADNSPKKFFGDK